MLLIAAQAVKLLDLPRFPPRPAKSIQSKLNGGRNGNMLKIGYKTRDGQKEKENEKSAGNHGKALSVSLSEEPENKTSFSLPL